MSPNIARARDGTKFRHYSTAPMSTDIYQFLEGNEGLEALILTNLGPRTIDRELLVNLQKDCPNLKRLEIRDGFGWPDRLNLLAIEDKGGHRCNSSALTHYRIGRLNLAGKFSKF